MEPFEVMTSESQERMLAIVEPGDLDEVLAICARWEVRRLGGRHGHRGRPAADPRPGRRRGARRRPGVVAARGRPAATTGPAAEPADRAARQADSADEALPAPADAARPTCSTCSTTRRGCVASTTTSCSSTRSRGRAATPAVLRLKHPTTGVDTGRALALTADGNHRWCALDPRQGTALVVAEAVLNLACVGARPLALVNCLNFGNPEHPEVDVAAVRGGRRHGRGVPRPVGCRWSAATSASTTRAAAATSTPPRSSAWSA